MQEVGGLKRVGSTQLLEDGVSSEADRWRRRALEAVTRSGREKSQQHERRHDWGGMEQQKGKPAEPASKPRLPPLSAREPSRLGLRAPWTQVDGSWNAMAGAGSEQLLELLQLHCTLTPEGQLYSIQPGEEKTRSWTDASVHPWSPFLSGRRIPLVTGIIKPPRSTFRNALTTPVSSNHGASIGTDRGWDPISRVQAMCGAGWDVLQGFWANVEKRPGGFYHLGLLQETHLRDGNDGGGTIRESCKEWHSKIFMV